MDDTTTGGNTDSSPATFAEAFAADASPAADTSTQTTTPSAAEQPTAAPESTPGTEDRSPFIPRARFDEVNTKLNELKQWREQYGWAEQVAPDQLSQMVTYFQKAQSDPTAFMAEYLNHVRESNPEAIAQLRSEFARQLASGRQQAGSGTPDLNGIVIDLGNGQTLSLGDLKSQWLNEVRQELQPVVKTVESVNAERAFQKALNDANTFATTTVQDASGWPGMDDKANRLAVAERIKGYQLTSDDPRDLQIALNRAWREVVLPKLSSRTESRLLDSLQQKAAASTTVNPGSAAPSTPRQYQSFTDLPAEAWR